MRDKTAQTLTSAHYVLYGHIIAEHFDYFNSKIKVLGIPLAVFQFILFMEQSTIPVPVSNTEHTSNLDN